MQSCIYLLGVLLASQVGSPTGDRYGQSVVPPGTETQAADSSPFAESPFAASDQEAGQTPAGQPAQNPLRGSGAPTTPPVNSAPPATGSPFGNQPGNSDASNTPPAGSPPTGTPPAGTPPQTSPRTAAPQQPRMTKVQKPIDLLKSLVTLTPQQELTGTPFALADAVKDTQSRLQQSQRVRLYWNLSQAVSEYYLTVREELELQSQRNGLLQAGQAWAEAQDNAAARRKMALSAVKVAQLRLQKACGLPSNAGLPLPSDLPHCGSYQSKYEQIFKSRTSSEAQQLAELLPLRHQQLSQMSDETTAALNWHSRIAQQRSAQNGATLLLKAYEQLALQRRAFVRAAYQYNAEIARYTELAVPQDVAPVHLVAMLIQTDKQWQAGSIQRASAEEPSGNTQRTFRPEGRNKTMRVPAGGEQSERSILVKPGDEAS